MPTKKPARKKATRKKPARKKPARKKPSRKKSSRKKPARKKPARKKPARKKPARKKAARKKAKARSKKAKARRRKTKAVARMLQEAQDEVEEYAILWGVDYDSAEDVLESIQFEDDEAPSPEEIDAHIREMWESLGGEDGPWSISDLYDIYYGYTPSSSE